MKKDTHTNCQAAFLAYIVTTSLGLGLIVAGMVVRKTTLAGSVIGPIFALGGGRLLVSAVKVCWHEFGKVDVHR